MLRNVAIVILELATAGPMAACEHGKLTVGTVRIGWLETMVPPETGRAGAEPAAMYPSCSARSRRLLTRGGAQRRHGASAPSSLLPSPIPRTPERLAPKFQRSDREHDGDGSRGELPPK